MGRKPITNPITSGNIELLANSKIIWEDFIVKDHRYTTHKVICGSCGKGRYVNRSSIKGKANHPFTGICRKCWRFFSVPPKVYPGWLRGKREYAKTLTSEGYLSLQINGLPDEDQELCKTMTQRNGKSPRVLEHRYIMAKYLGRPLHKQEVVHHKNGNKTDNRIDNLELRVAYHGKGNTPHELRQEIERLKSLLEEHNIQH